MRTIQIVLAVLFLFPVLLFSQQRDSSVHCLVVSGKALINGNVSADVTVKLICNNVEIGRETLNGKHPKFSFTVKSNNYYTIKIFKKGYISRAVYFNTFLPATVSTTPMYKFDFEVELLSKKDKIDNEYYDYPIAIVEYRADRDVFDYSKKYTDVIKSKIVTGKTNFISVHKL